MAMHQRRFGRTNLKLPVFSCGGMRFQESWKADAKIGKASQRNLQATVDRALDVGINHFETARGYGTSEVQLGRALAGVPRNRFVLQTKTPPLPDPAEFERRLQESFTRLGVDHIDLFAFHGVNNPERIKHTLDCYGVADRYRRQGRIGHIGFSTHGNLQVILSAIRTNLFDYLNLHWYFIFQENLPAIAAAAEHDMGVFIISPSDKGGHLHTPRPLWIRATAPWTPMQFNDLFCLSNPEVHVLSLGAARPSDFDEHLAILPHLDDAAREVAPIVQRLETHLHQAVGADFARHHLDGVPEWEQIPGGINVRKILWLYTLVKGWDLEPYARTRYNMLSTDDHWFPGNKAVDFDASALRTALQDSPFREYIPDLLRQTHALLNQP